ncbi:hypothetical protein FNV43_RR06195 [Rhamnella rubrinervis]|uniref:Uncharacterized protein n=1 Tax=Rhamnella rubrinervis TaxID=2594499 RepID=A0A8K0HD38_9ROSA|nr:hypothetical protein FNV43_RR06195 [Rhamnella rubrinervis]
MCLFLRAPCPGQPFPLHNRRESDKPFLRDSTIDALPSRLGHQALPSNLVLLLFRRRRTGLGNLKAFCSSKQKRCRHCQDTVSPMPRSYSMHIHHHPQSKGDTYHAVALTSSTLGSLKLDSANQNDDDKRV